MKQKAMAQPGFHSVCGSGKCGHDCSFKQANQCAFRAGSRSFMMLKYFWQKVTAWKLMRAGARKLQNLAGAGSAVQHPGPACPPGLRPLLRDHNVRCEEWKLSQDNSPGEQWGQ